MAFCGAGVPIWIGMVGTDRAGAVWTSTWLQPFKAALSLHACTLHPAANGESLTSRLPFFDAQLVTNHPQLHAYAARKSVEALRRGASYDVRVVSWVEPGCRKSGILLSSPQGNCRGRAWLL